MNNQWILISLVCIVALGCDSKSTDNTTNNNTANSTPTNAIQAVEMQCNSNDNADSADFEVTDWTEQSHSNSASPNYSLIFAENQVQRIDIVVSCHNWQTMINEMTQLYGNFGVRNRGGGLADVANPSFVPASIMYNGSEWYRVGVRFKGNSSLQSTWQSGLLKLSLKLDFDEFEDNYNQIANQRFYGFKQLSLKNNYDDKSQIREKVVTDIYRRAGRELYQVAFYQVYVDYGFGAQYFGLYSMVEEVDDTAIDNIFGNDDGNLYKPDGVSAAFIENSFNQADFVKQNNELQADWSDIMAMFTALHNNIDAVTWRANLEKVFDVEVFLQYLAINGVIQNWDAYGRLTHNYFLYNNPNTQQLTWIPWDHNEALQTGKQGGSLALDFSNLTQNAWPLIAKIYADPVYKAKYDDYVQMTIEGAFETVAIQALYDSYASLIASAVAMEREGFSFLQSSSDFDAAISTLKNHAVSRKQAVSDYLNNQP